MLRELQTITGKNIDSMHKTAISMLTGMGAVKSYIDKTVGLPTVNMTEGFYFVNKQRIPTGTDTIRDNISDYDTGFVEIKKDEFVNLIPPMTGERYAVDQFDTAGLIIGNAVMLGTDGKFVKSTMPSKLIYGGEYNDAGHILHVIEISGTQITN